MTALELEATLRAKYPEVRWFVTIDGETGNWRVFSRKVDDLHRVWKTRQLSYLQAEKGYFKHLEEDGVPALGSPWAFERGELEGVYGIIQGLGLGQEFAVKLRPRYAAEGWHECMELTELNIRELAKAHRELALETIREAIQKPRRTVERLLARAKLDDLYGPPVTREEFIEKMTQECHSATSAPVDNRPACDCGGPAGHVPGGVFCRRST